MAKKETWKTAQWEKPMMPAPIRFGFTMLMDELDKRYKELNKQQEALELRIRALEREQNG